MSVFVIEHSMVGVHRRGQVVEFDKDQDTDRLLRVGAIRKAEQVEERNAVKFGDTDEDVPRVFPAVPFDSIKPSPDPLRGEVAPTLPQEGFRDHTTPIGGTLSQEPKPLKK